MPMPETTEPNATPDPQDRLIRLLLLGGATAAFLGFLVTAVVIMVMISTNFNFLQWME